MNSNKKINHFLSATVNKRNFKQWGLNEYHFRVFTYTLTAKKLILSILVTINVLKLSTDHEYNWYVQILMNVSLWLMQIHVKCRIQIIFKHICIQNISCQTKITLKFFNKFSTYSYFAQILIKLIKYILKSNYSSLY